MNEIDLFPDELRKKLLFYRWFKMTGVALCLITITAVSGFLFLRDVNADIREQIQVFQSQREISDTNRQRLDRLNIVVTVKEQVRSCFTRVADDHSPPWCRPYRRVKSDALEVLGQP